MSGSDRSSTLTFPAQLGTANSQPARPNILFVVADDHRADAIGAHGNGTVRTPVLDRLVALGATFSRATIAGGLMAAVCAPSRACLLTGRGVFRADANPAVESGPHYEVRLPADAATLPEWFRAAGYATFFTGKWHNDLPALLRSFGQGENIFHGGMCDHTGVPVCDLDGIRADAPARVADGFSSEIFCGSAEKFIRRRATGQPFFAWIALTSPHDPRTPPADFAALYEPARIPLPGNFQPAHAFDNGELDVRDERLAPRPLSPGVVREHLAAYYGMISHHDACIGRVLLALEEVGQADNTIVVYVSDHGLALGSHGLLGKQNLYEHSVRVPLILAGPGVPAARRCDGLVHPQDLFATLCELAGLPPPPGLDSRSLVTAMVGNGGGREFVCSVYMDKQRMVTDGRWKLIVYRVVGAERVQLFDLDGDPDECRDVAGDLCHAGRIAALRARLESWQSENGDRWFNATASSRSVA